MPSDDSSYDPSQSGTSYTSYFYNSSYGRSYEVQDTDYGYSHSYQFTERGGGYYEHTRQYVSDAGWHRNYLSSSYNGTNYGVASYGFYARNAYSPYGYQGDPGDEISYKSRSSYRPAQGDAGYSSVGNRNSYYSYSSNTYYGYSRSVTSYLLQEPGGQYTEGRYTYSGPYGSGTIDYSNYFANLTYFGYGYG